MAEKEAGPNKGVPMSNGIGGTITVPGASGEGSYAGVGQYIGSGSSNNNTGGDTAAGGDSGSGDSGSSQSNPPELTNAEYVQQAVDNYLGTSALFWGFEEIVDIYIDKKLNAENWEEEYLEEQEGLIQEEIDAIKQYIKEEKEKLKEQFKNTDLKDELKKKFDELKITAKELKDDLKPIPAEFAKIMSEALMPNVIGPVGPNPLSTALKIYLGIARVKKLVDRAFISLQLFLTVAESLGINKTQPFNQFMAPLAASLRGLANLLERMKKKEEEGQDLLEYQEQVEKAKKDWSYTNYGESWTAQKIEERARGDNFKMFEFPLSSNNRKDLHKYEKQIDAYKSWKRQRAKTAIAILKYDDWLNWLINQLKKGNQQLASGASSGDSGSTSQGQFSGSTRVTSPNGAP